MEIDFYGASMYSQRIIRITSMKGAYLVKRNNTLTRLSGDDHIKVISVPMVKRYSYT